MAVRAWLDDDSEIRVPVHAGTSPVEALEVYVLLKPGAKSGFERVMGGNSSDGTARWTLGMDSSNIPFFFVNNGSHMILPTEDPELGTEDWWEIVYSKTDLTGGTFRFHNLTTDEVIHTPGDAVGTIAFPESIAGGSIRFGEAGGDDLHAKVAVAAIRADAADEEAWDGIFAGPSSQAIATLFEAGSAWNFNQTDASDPIPDLTGKASRIQGTIDDSTDRNGISGTTIVFDDDPPGWDFTTVPPPLQVRFYGSGTSNIGGAINTNVAGEEAAGLEGVLLDVMRDITRGEAVAGTTVYRGFYAFLEDNGFETPAALEAYLETDLPEGVSAALAAAAEGPGGTIEELADETTAPAGVSFSAPTEGSPLDLGTAEADEGTGLWLRVTVGANNAGRLGNRVTVHVDHTPL